MKRNGAVLAVFLVGMGSLSACSKAEAPPAPSSFEALALSGRAAPMPVAPAASAASAAGSASSLDDVATERKVVRTANMGIEAGDPLGAERTVVSTIEKLGGYVVSANRTLRTDTTPGNADDRTTTVNMVLSVPSAHFTQAMADLQIIGSRVLEEQISTDDVTYEFIDVKARLAAERALEQQFLEILKQAKSVKDALEVNTHIAEVRTNIEKLEGRQRFLERQTSFSTIHLTISPNAPVVRVGRFAFGETFEHASADLLNVTADILHGTIRIAGFLTPIAIFVVLPLTLLGRALVRRRRLAASA